MEDTKTIMPRNRLDPAAIDANSITDSTFPSSKGKLKSHLINILFIF